MKHEFAIMNISTNPPTYIDDNNKLVIDVNKAKRFDTIVAGRDGKSAVHEALAIWGDEQNNYAVVPVPVEPLVPPQKRIPVPDFYETVSYTTAEHICEILSDHSVEMCFTPTDVITCSGQMASHSVNHPITGEILGREFLFSFPGCITTEEKEKLRKMCDGWDVCTVHHRGHGITSWIIVKLQVGRK